MDKAVFINFNKDYLMITIFLSRRIYFQGLFHRKQYVRHQSIKVVLISMLNAVKHDSQLEHTR
ncbi:hypothetical protein V1478_002255 [Vespula squamosa]|uniref:Uncharacterized protein n=1 Tax=Vespula squamosa TaxID=30214 RepID=A0ABD2BW44_VESSQ